MEKDVHLTTSVHRIDATARYARLEKHREVHVISMKNVSRSNVWEFLFLRNARMGSPENHVFSIPIVTRKSVRDYILLLRHAIELV